MTTPRRSRSSWVAAAALTLLVNAPAEAQALRGAAELQYQNVERAGITQPLETWVKTVRADYARRFRRSFEFSSHLIYNEQTITGRPDRLRTPQGTLQLAHPYFGLLATYRPTESRDSKGLTNRQQELSLGGYVQRAGLPRISGSWVRRHHDPTAEIPSSVTVTRDLAGLYNLGATNLRAGYGDQQREGGSGLAQRRRDDHWDFGASRQLHARRADASLSYDFSQSRTNPFGARSQVSRLHTASASGGMQFSRRTAANLTYTFRRTESRQGGGVPATRIDQQDGALSLTHRLRDVILLSGSGGVRSATLDQRTSTERYLAVTASAEGDARPGWRLGASASHSLNWLPGVKVRPIESFHSNTQMRLAPGLSAVGDVTVTGARGVPATAGASPTPTEISVQTAAGINSNPLRTVFLDAAFQRFRSGTSLFGDGTATTTFNTNLRLRPSPRLQWNGTWGVVSGFNSRSTTYQTSFNWSPNPTLQTFGSYSRTRQERRDPVVPSSTGQESYAASVVMALTRDLSGTFRYTDSNPGQASHVRIVNAMLTQAFGR